MRFNKKFIGGLVGVLALTEACGPKQIESQKNPDASIVSIQLPEISKFPSWIDNKENKNQVPAPWACDEINSINYINFKEGPSMEAKCMTKVYAIFCKWYYPDNAPRVRRPKGGKLLYTEYLTYRLDPTVNINGDIASSLKDYKKARAIRRRTKLPPSNEGYGCVYRLDTDTWQMHCHPWVRFGEAVVKEK